jgi:hypothetical protein
MGMKCKKCKAEFEIKEIKLSQTYLEGEEFYCPFCGHDMGED